MFFRAKGIPLRTLTPMTALDLDALWLSTPGMEEYTGHSVKHGASAHLDEAAATGAVIDPVLKSRVLKHLSRADPEPRVSIRYGPSPAHNHVTHPAAIHKARALGTWQVTMLL
eukprot:TRINITY_DN3479_c0_g1_i9.p2 TRINITY_DN3479_c0_g1~~TRINITY_DN3479_c0_g1_i9.p2  ORF type:complete len:113 (+),score=16.52 TRINITY_DN3479_c0_g1_i9:289-627(+)